MLCNRDSAIQKCFQEVLHSLQVRKFDSLSALRTTCHTVRTSICPKCQSSGYQSAWSIIHPKDENFSSGPSSVWKSFKLLQHASVQTFQQHVWTTLSVRQASRFLSKTQLWEDRCNRPDNVDSHLDELIHKASIVIQIQMSGRRSSWSGCSCIRYGNCVHHINRPDDHPPSPDARSLYMEIICSGRATVRMTSTTVQTRLKNKKEFQRKSQEVDHTVVRPNNS